MGMAGALFLIARGERDFEFARGDHGVFEEELVKIAEAEHQQGVGHLLLDAVVLPHERRGGVTHELAGTDHTRDVPIRAATVRERFSHDATRRFPAA